MIFRFDFKNDATTVGNFSRREDLFLFLFLLHRNKQLGTGRVDCEGDIVVILLNLRGTQGTNYFESMLLVGCMQAIVDSKSGLLLCEGAHLAMPRRSLIH